MSGEFPASTVTALGRPGFIGSKQIISNVQNFTVAGSFTWTQPTPPPGKIIIGYRVAVLASGAGGGRGQGQSGSAGSPGGDGGGGGGYAAANFTPVAFPASVAVTIGAGVPGAVGLTTTTGVAVPKLAPTNGNSSSFGTFISATGGAGSVGGAGTITGPGVVAGTSITENGGAGGPGGNLDKGTAGVSTLHGAGPGGGGGGGEADSLFPFNASAGGASGTRTPGTVGVTDEVPATQTAGKSASFNATDGAGSGAAWSHLLIEGATSGRGGDALVPGCGGGASGGSDASTLGQPATVARGGASAAGYVSVTTFFG